MRAALPCHDGGEPRLPLQPEVLPLRLHVRVFVEPPRRWAVQLDPAPSPSPGSKNLERLGLLSRPRPSRRRDPSPYPSCPVVLIQASISSPAKTTAHPVCSVAMGSEPDSPLDETLRVRGVENLRIADASARPQIPRANANAPSIMICE